MSKVLPTKTELHELKDFLILWSTQGISQLGSSITAFALTLWLYEKTGSALSTAALAICTYAPYVLMSIFAGALSDRFDKKKTMLVCDLFAAVCTVAVLVLYKTGQPSGSKGQHPETGEGRSCLLKEDPAGFHHDPVHVGGESCGVGL